MYDPPEEAFSDTDLHAPVNPSGGYAGISHIEFCYDYELTATKTANAEYTRTYTWDITKEADANYSGFIGDAAFNHDYVVTVDQTVTDSAFKVTGQITINNPTPFEVPYRVSDSVNGTAAAVDCGGGLASGTLAPGGSVTCSYVAELGDTLPANGTNTATVSSQNPDVDGATATKDYTFGEPTTIVGYPTINVTDYFDGDPTGEALGSASGDFTFEYERDFACPTDEDAYNEGVYTESFPNTAKIDETDDSDDANVDLTCYAPVVSKTVTPAWEQDFQWDIAKNVDKTTFVGFAGDAWAFNYDVDVTLTSYDEKNFSASGVITVVNPHPSAAMVVGLTDAVNGFTGVITADADCEYVAGVLTIPEGGTATCGYTADMGDDQDANKDVEYTNTATATLGGGSFSGTASFKFNDVLPKLAAGSEPAQVSATDDNATAGDAGDDRHSATLSWTTQNVIAYQQAGVCPPEESAYTNGVWTLTLTNIAKIDQTTDSDTETVTVTCYVPAKAKVVKTTLEGPADIGQPFSFELYAPGTYPGGPPVETKGLTTSGTSGTYDVAFDKVFKIADEGTWTVKEVLPEGWLLTVPAFEPKECTFTVAFPTSAGQTFECAFTNVEMTRVKVLKLTNGMVDPDRDWEFVLYWIKANDPEKILEEIARDSVQDADGYLDFDDLNLDPYKSYALCEINLPAGWYGTWMLDLNLDGELDAITPYNPDVPEDLGTRCFDFGPGTYSEEQGGLIGKVVEFQVDNNYPGGEPRTPGYWKNWNTCSGGNQQYVAERNGGFAEGFWLLDDVLPQLVGDLNVDSCEIGVKVLNREDLEGTDKKNDKRANDAAYGLGSHLLAAKANLEAGAEYCPAALTAVDDAQALLERINFVGTGSYLDPKNKSVKDDRDEALRLTGLLDSYNNGMLCP